MSKWRIVERTAQEGSTIVPHTIFRGEEEVARGLAYSEACRLVARDCLGNDRITEEYASGRSATLTGRQLRESLEKSRAFDEGKG